MILNKAENESQTQVANHFFFFYYLLCVAPPTLSRRTRRGKNGFRVPPSKLNLTRQTRSCAPCFVCLQKKIKNEEAISVQPYEERGRQHLLDVFSVGIQAGLCNIVEGYFSPVWSAVH